MYIIIKPAILKITVFVFLALSIPTLSAQNIPQELRTITGVITHQETRLSGVNVFIKNTKQGTKTNAKGIYTLKAKPGDLIVYSYLGYKTLKILVEDITKVLNIEMPLASEQLEEVFVKTRASNEAPDNRVTNAWGPTKKITDATSTVHVKGEDLGEAFYNIGDALDNEGVPGIIGGSQSARTSSLFFNTALLWDVDGVLYESVPEFLLVSTVKELKVIKSLSDLSRYGSLGAGGVVVVTTYSAASTYEETNEKKKTAIAKEYYNKNVYDYKALHLSNLKPHNVNLINRLKNLYNKQKAFSLIKNQLESNEINFHDAIETVPLFINYYNDITSAVWVLDQLEEKYKTNPELLKAIAYYYQQLSRNQDAVRVFENVFLLRPRYMQSYMDLANAYKNTGQYKRAWRMYIGYFNQGAVISDKELAKLVSSEMEWLYFMRNKQTDIKDKFVSNSRSIDDFRQDIRLVVEWNSSDADFVIEFVGKENRAFHFIHTLQDNQEVIFNEKLLGYSSREYIIDNLENNKWLVNITYLGNKKPEPTYFKFTLYRNWGKPNEQKQIKVLKLHTEREKYNLFTLIGKELTKV